MLKSKTGCIAAAILTLTSPVSSLAQSANEVTLSFADGQDSLSGTLLEFRDDKYFLETSIGLVAIPSNGASCEGTNCPNTVTTEPEDTQILLEAKNGSFSFAGELLEIDGDAYVLKTSVGVQRIPDSLVNCQGTQCLAPQSDLPMSRVVELSNGKITLKGELLAFENQIYTVDDKRMGKVQVGASAFKCIGDSCP